MAPVKLRCDAGLGPSTITLFGAVCGESESGKTEAAKVATELVPRADRLRQAR